MPRRRWISLLLPLVALAILLVLARRGGEEDASPGGSTPPAREDATRPPAPKAPEPARLEGTPADEGMDEAGVVIRGEVADADDTLRAGVSVRLLVDGAVVAETATDAEGRFQIETDLPPGEGVLYGVVEARDEEGAGALRMLALRADPAWGERRVPRRQAIGRLVLQALHPFEVRVLSTCAAAPPARIRIRHGLFHDGPDYLVADTDAQGVLRVDGLPAGTWRALVTADGCGRGSAFFQVPRPDGAPVDVHVAPPRDVRVEVVDGLTGEPVAGARLEVHEWLQRPSGTERATYRPPLDVAPTDEHGLTVIPGLGEQDELDVVATADGYPQAPEGRWMTDMPGYAHLAAGATEARIELMGERTVTWPIEPGEAPVPPDGTEVRILPPGDAEAAVPPTGRIVGGKLVVPGWPAGYALGRALTSDGAVADLRAGMKETLGPPIRFHHPRAIEVRLAYPDGAPAPGFYVVAAQPGGTPISPPVPTDERGVARIENLHGAGLARVDVKVAEQPVPYGRHPIGTVSLATGDATVAYVVQRPRDVVVHVRVDGEPKLPPTFVVSVGTDRFTGSEVVRDEAAATLSMRWRPWRLGVAVHVSVAAPDLLPGTTDVEVGEGDAPLEAVVELRHGGSFVVDVVAPPDDRYRILLQRWDSARRAWTEFGVVNAPRRADEEGEMRFGPLPAGLYRAYERYAGVVSTSAEVAPPGDEARVRLDLSTVAVVEGRVEVPEGFAGQRAFVRVLGADEPPAAPSWMPAPDPRAGWVGTITDEDGAFAVRVPGDRDVTLTPRAPFLEPAAEGGEEVARGARKDVVLRLVKAPVAAFRYDREPPETGRPRTPQPIDVLLYEGEPEGEPAHRLQALLEWDRGRFSGYPEGTFTVWIDAVPFAPVVLRDVVFGAGDVDLGTLKTSDGSTFVARLEPREGFEPPFVTVSATREDAPRYMRTAMSPWGTEIRLTGIGAGRFRVTVVPRPTGPSLDETIEFDGTTTVERTLKP